jgi:ketosteroid isomerase-like protein
MGSGHVETARRGYRAWAEGDWATVFEDSTPDLEFVPAVAASVEGGSITGQDEIRRFFTELRETWERFEIEMNEFREVGDRVMGIGRLTARGRGSELELDQPIYSVAWFRDGKIARMQSFLDLEAAESAAGKVVE